MSVTITKGQVHAYRFFDIGEEIDLATARSQVTDANFHTYRVRHVSRSLLLNDHPLAIALPAKEHTIAGQTYTVGCLAKLWSFGAISIRFTLDLRTTSMDKLCEISWYLENDEPFHSQAVQTAQNLISLVKPSIVSPKLWEQHEDYLIFDVKNAEGLSDDVSKSFLNTSMASLILGEKPMHFSPSILESLQSGVFQYTRGDLTLVHWNGAFIYDHEDADDLGIILEFACCQLLELRYYDNLLDRQLATLYQHIEDQPHPSLFRNPYKDLARKAALQYIDLSELIDRIANATKVLSDFYYASTYRAATKNLRHQDWKDAVDRKLANIAEVSKIFQGEINEQRNQVMEFTIIILIAIEVVPFLYNLVSL